MFTVSTVVGTVFVVGGSFFLALIAVALWRGVSSRGWPTAEGEILESRIEEEFDEGSLSYHPKVRYRYWVNDQEHVSDELTYRAYSADLAAVEEIVARYPAGSRIQVHYDPRHSERAVLEPGASLKGALGIAVLVVVIIAVGVGQLLGMM